MYVYIYIYLQRERESYTVAVRVPVQYILWPEGSDIVTWSLREHACMYMCIYIYIHVYIKYISDTLTYSCYRLSYPTLA